MPELSAAQREALRVGTGGDPMRAYRCTVCGMVTTADKTTPTFNRRVHKWEPVQITVWPAGRVVHEGGGDVAG